MNPSLHPPSKLKRIWAGVLLTLFLVQVLSFFVGLVIPTFRVAVLWGKTVDERRAFLSPSAAVFKASADRFPLTARVYLVDPDATSHKNSLYYFYPRVVSITMTDACYEGAYETWNERPPMGWLVTNGYTYVISFKDSKVTKVRASPPQPEGSDAK